MAIYGAGSLWNKQELKTFFFNNENFVIGWDIRNAEDLYTQISYKKTGDIVYLKSNKPGSNEIRIKGIGMVRLPLIQNIFNNGIDLSTKNSNFELPVKWIIKDEKITIPQNIGKLTNVRAPTLYEEHLEFVQTAILNSVFSKLKP